MYNRVVMNYKVTVEGDLVAKDGTGRMLEFYEESFILDFNDKNKALSLIKKGLITERLRKRDGFKSVRTCGIVSIEETNSLVAFDDLAKLMMKAIELNCVPENIDNYKRPDYKEKALQKAIALAEKRNKE